MLVQVLIGVVLGGLYILLVARYDVRLQLRLLAIGLAVAALIYLAFGAAGGGGRWLAIEAGGVVLFTALAWLGSAAVPILMGVGWAAHACWDVGLHLEPAVSFVPAWYPVACLGLDLVVAGYALGLSPALRTRVTSSFPT